jgi:hypothetical protein
MNLTLIIYTSLKYKTMSKKDLAAARLKNFEFSMACLNNFMCGSSDRRRLHAGSSGPLAEPPPVSVPAMTT